MLQRKVLTLVFVRRPAAQDAAGAAGSVLLGWKKRGFGAFRYNGFGGKVEPGETVAAAAARELLEESCVTATALALRGRLYFEFVGDSTLLDVHVFEATAWHGTPAETEEMRPEWFLEDEVPFDRMWIDDRLWLPTFLAGETFSCYALFKGETTIVDYDLRAGLVQPEIFRTKWACTQPTLALLPGL